MQGSRNSFHCDVKLIETGKVRIILRSFESSIPDFKIWNKRQKQLFLRNKFWHRHTSKWLQFLSGFESMEFHLLWEIQVTGESRLLFVHQTKFPSCLLERYGNSIRPLHATYKTTKYSLPLFFVVVKTNVDYQVVSSFVVQDETSTAITEPLK